MSANNTFESYFDQGGERIAAKTGYAALRKEYNEQNKLIEQSYYDEEGDQAKCAQQYSIQRYEYDNLGRQILIDWFTVSEEPYVNKKGYISMVTTYASDGSKLDTYYNANWDEISVNK